MRMVAKETMKSMAEHLYLAVQVTIGSTSLAMDPGLQTVATETTFSMLAVSKYSLLEAKAATHIASALQMTEI